ncbi:MAG: hypothetical protein R2865_10840 [Deinococcales bacterium]
MNRELPPANIAVLILAAGKASRIGQAKMLLKAGEGHSLLSRAIELSLSLGQIPLIITGPITRLFAKA